ncbi:acyl-CoA dehydrogenase family protein [Palleronia caenipelagi]|uniref:Flavin-dependent monooxygenase n=1 Tax=Palleronia caenipelagi TaxID=2489174 RepID=A0A547PK97_9RHOB|nr:acyl-CoA dehydrogenase family protein [Palleronia caenipelagi]TRD14582.1 flavin-dependent monooxygenase [Palleronia caenipelagi]
MTAQDSVAKSSIKKEEVLSEIERRANEFNRLRHIPPDVISKFKSLGVYRALVPKRFGGDARSPSGFCRLIEDISAADASAGWVASFGVSAAYLSTLPPTTYEKIYSSNPDTVFAGAMFPPQLAQAATGGYEVSGRWPWGSGVLCADLVGAGIKIEDKKSELPIIAVIPKQRVKVLDTWNALSLRGTGSHDFSVDQVVVPNEWTFVRGAKPTMDDRLFRYPSMALASQVLAVVALGAARAALDYVKKSGSRQSITGAPKPSSRSYFQTGYTKAVGKYLGAQALFYDTLDEAYEELEHNETVQPETHIRLRLVASKAARDGAEAARIAFVLGGSNVLNEDHPLLHKMLDAAGVAQHAFLAEGTFTAAGAAFFEEPTFQSFP